MHAFAKSGMVLYQLGGCGSLELPSLGPQPPHKHTYMVAKTHRITWGPDAIVTWGIVHQFSRNYCWSRQGEKHISTYTHKGNISHVTEGSTGTTPCYPVLQASNTCTDVGGCMNTCCLGMDDITFCYCTFITTYTEVNTPAAVAVCLCVRAVMINDTDLSHSFMDVDSRL